MNRSLWLPFTSWCGGSIGDFAYDLGPPATIEFDL